MTARLGVILLVHTAFDRAEQVARHWARAGCPVVIHVDRAVPRARHDAFARALSDEARIVFSRRFRCEWGTWSLVAATQAAAETLLSRFPDVGHVYLASGACLPIRPVEELIDYLAARPETDFIESATTAEVPWTVGGLHEERFTLAFPFAWKRQRRLFDAYVELQRRIGRRREMPDGLVPHMGSQWWCLTRETLAAILRDPNRAAHDRFFRRVWIPDESYFQTLARRHARRIESRSLTVSKFDYQGRPHIFYDDHLTLLRRSRCFVARKIWPGADRLYDAFLTEAAGRAGRAEPDPARIDRLFAKGAERRTRARPGLWMQSSFPAEGRETSVTAAPYTLLHGFAELFEGVEAWLTASTGARVHGHLFAPERAEFADGATVIEGALTDSAALRDANPKAFLTSLIWNTRGRHQCFQFGPRDDQSLNWTIAQDPNARIAAVTGAWAVPLFRSGRPAAEVRAEAAHLQAVEADHLKVLRSPWTAARIRVWSMAEVVATPAQALRSVLSDMGAPEAAELEMPRLVDLEGFGAFLQELKNQGMHPYLTGDFPTGPASQRAAPRPPRKPYVVREP
ncbi:glycosyl transferase [Rhodosalinus sediminis]|uniref:Peptide O-xylosyltransferase n=1 Tax=Rhodosalinus sediminis TaxID=1940533 RepID=A0A3D9BXU4_9RHOB|nr:beta-1,6-N-acetylglucosaminyltransferase [Rhodosalinus sediminis]REC58335.1 glycosyl transferase [Rhodosalinus sediminis]